MDPTQNQSGTPGPIFSAGPAPEEPSMASAPSGSGPKNPFSRGGDIVLQPSNDYYSGGAKPRSKKPIIIIGAIAVIAVIILLVALPLLNKGSKADYEQKNKLYRVALSMQSSYSYALAVYDDIIGFDAANGNLTQHPESILFSQSESYDKIPPLDDLLQEYKEISEKFSKYNSDLDYIIDNIQPSIETIRNNFKIMKELNEAFITPIQNAENWQYTGCISNTKTQELINSSDKKLASIAQKYNQLACKDNIQIVFGYGELRIPESVDESTMDLLKEISNSLASYFGTIDIDSKDEVLAKLGTIMNETKPEEQNESEKDE